MQPESETKTVTREFDGEKFDVVVRTLKPMFPFAPSVKVVDGIRHERDVAMKLRDGTTIYTDIYRPEGATNVPAIVCWHPYGKNFSETGLMMPGLAPGLHSPQTKLEGPDPEYWCRRGYAIVNPDPRGVGHSEGELEFWTRQEARDQYDFIEWLAKQAWCNGKVGMSGNSYPAVTQWSAAAEKPPSLACIAPWEGATDIYNHVTTLGGVPDDTFGFFDLFMQGPGWGEAMLANIAKHPMRDAFWREKVPELEKIEIPAYVCGGWSHYYHLKGAVDGFRRIKSTAKWLRIHREFEWPDYYAPENLADLDRFFERYLKGHRNGWEMTPRVRIDVMDRGDRDHAVRRAETDFPLPDTVYRKFFLNAADKSLSSSQPAAASQASYADRTGLLTFDLTFDRDTELTGLFKLRLWVEVRGSDDTDLFVFVQKADGEGNMVPTMCLTQAHPGNFGILRVSHREIDPSRSTESEPFHPHLKRQPLKPGEIVPVDIPMWPTSRFWRKGERLRVVVAGDYFRQPGGFENSRLIGFNQGWGIRNEGQTVIHTGGQYDSHLLAPMIPDPRPVILGSSISSYKPKDSMM